MINAANNDGWIIEEFILPGGWQHGGLYPEVYKSYYEALEAFRGVHDKKNFRVYERLV